MKHYTRLKPYQTKILLFEDEDTSLAKMLEQIQNFVHFYIACIIIVFFTQGR